MILMNYKYCYMELVKLIKIKERKGFWRTINLVGFCICWLIETLIYNFKGYVNYTYFGFGMFFLIATWVFWND